MNIKTHLINNDWLKGIPYSQKGWGNGYIGVPLGHPWHGKPYDNIDADIHGGLTYARDHAPNLPADGYWWIGFDTLHCDDSLERWPKEAVEAETESLKQQALAAINRPDDETAHYRSEG